MFVPRPYNRPTSLIRREGDGLAVRLLSESGERMATLLRPMTLRDALTQPFFVRRTR